MADKSYLTLDHPRPALPELPEDGIDVTDRSDLDRHAGKAPYHRCPDCGWVRGFPTTTRDGTAIRCLSGWASSASYCANCHRKIGGTFLVS